MTKALILVASLGLSLSAAQACNFMHTADNAKLDKTEVASIATEKALPMSVPADKAASPAENAKVQPPAGQQAD